MPIQLVYKATIGSKTSAEVIVASGSTICIPQGAALEFKVKNTTGRAGAWTWTAVGGTITQSGENGGRVTCSVVTAAVGAPATLTATPGAGGAALTVRLIVFSVTGRCVPVDNFGGRAADKLGVCEIVKLSATLLPAGLNLATYGLSLVWKVVGVNPQYKTLGAVLSDRDVNATGDIIPAAPGAAPGSAIYVAPWKPHVPNVASSTEQKTDITLSLQLEGGPVANQQLAKKVYGIVTPHAHMVRAPGTPAKHFNPGVAVAAPGTVGATEEPSAGFQGHIYLTPKNVSFHRLRWKEGTGAMTLWGACLAAPGEEGLQHHDTVWANDDHGTVTTGNNATGCWVNQIDNVRSAAAVPMQDFIDRHGQKGATVVGGKTWPIEWKYTYMKHDNSWADEFVVFQKAFHTYEVKGNGSSTCFKRCATRNCTTCMTAVEVGIGAAHEW